MKKVFIDEYLSIQLRQRIDKLVELNLDLESVLSLLSNDLYEYDDYMVDEIKRYVRYLFWLRDHHKDRSLAFEKYKKQTKQEAKAEKNLPANSKKTNSKINFTNEFFLTQIRKDRKRIEEISNLNYTKKNPEEVKTIVEEPNLKTLALKDNLVDEILESLSDEEIQATLNEILTNDLDSTIVDFNQAVLTQTPKFNDDNPKKEKTILDDPSDNYHPKTLIEQTKKIEDLTFDDILTDHSLTLLNSDSTQTLFNLDYLEDNGTETLNDSILLEEEELNLQSFTTGRTPINQIDQETKEESAISSETEQALNFLDNLEEKYGNQTLITLNAEKHDLKTADFTLAEPTSTLKLGVHVHYLNHDYVVEEIKTEFDFFHHQQEIVTLIDPQNQEKIQVNAKKIK